jgi:hypothetical protein
MPAARNPQTAPGQNAPILPSAQAHLYRCMKSNFALRPGADRPSAYFGHYVVLACVDRQSNLR